MLTSKALKKDMKIKRETGKQKKTISQKYKIKKQKNLKNHRQKELLIYLKKYQYQTKNKKRKNQLTNRKRKKKIAHIGKIKVGVDSERYVDWNIKISVGI